MAGLVDARPIVVIGAGGHAKVVIELLRANGWMVVACTDADASARTLLGVPVVGNDAALPGLRADGIGAAFVALGNNAVRERVGMKLEALGFDRPAAVSPFAAVSPTARIGAGAAVMAGAAINAEATIGDFAIVNTRAGIDHDDEIGQAAHIGPGCALAGCVQVGARSFLGAGCTVIPMIKIGSDVMVGAGGVVVRDLADGVKAYGVPARERRQV